MTIKINDIEYKIKYTIRALFIFERIAQHSFELKTMLDNYVFFYSLILANNQDKPLQWDDFIDALDNDPSLFKQLSDFLMEKERQDEMFIEQEEVKEDGNVEKKS